MGGTESTPNLDARRQAVAAVWEGVVEAAGFSLDEVAYWTSEETPSEIRDRAAMYFLPGPNLEPPHAFTGAQLEEATGGEMARKHRIMVHVDYELSDDLGIKGTEAFFAAVLRHELEHARQARAPNGRLALEVDQHLVDPVLFKRAGGIKGGAEHYNMKPSELDANAAASVYVRSCFPGQVPILMDAEICGAMLRSNTEPEDPGSLLRRTVCFLFQFRSIAEALSETIPVASRLDLYGGADAAAIWNHLTA